VVRGKNSHLRLRINGCENFGGESDGRCGIPLRWFRQDLFPGNFRKLADNLAA